MKSIRWSLILYFLLLVGLALGAVSTFVYQNTRGILVAKENNERTLRTTENQKRKDDLRAAFDKELLGQATNLHSGAQLSVNFTVIHMRSHLLTQIGVFGGTSSRIIAEEPNGPLADWYHRFNVAEIQLDEQLIRPIRGGAEQSRPEYSDKQYFQINSNWGSTPWRSKSMGELTFAVDPEVFKKMAPMAPYIEEKELAPGHKVRCLMLLAPVTAGGFRPIFWKGPPGRQGPSNGSDGQPPRDRDRERGRGAGTSGMVGPTLPPPAGPPPRPGPEPADRSPRVPFMFLIQCASDTSELDNKLAGQDLQLASDLTELEDDSHATLATLRNRLLLISLAAFAGTVLGGFGLVHLQLRPLRRLSLAVGQVSVRDFRLPFDQQRLPSELRPIVERLRDTLDLLKRAFAREKQAAADISHELRTPLAALLTTTEVALRKQRTPEEYREVIQDCRASGQQMNVMVERLLALARLDAGVDQMRPRDVDVADLAEQCAGMVRPLAEAHNLTLRFHQQGAVQLKTDPDKLREVVNNLLHNAIQYNRPNGSVDLSVVRENGHLRLEVRDTGIGIAPEAREHIFERFFRADPSRQTDNLNAGLGLAIVKGYVDLMGGSIAVESTEGQGSTFRVQLPAH